MVEVRAGTVVMRQVFFAGDLSVCILNTVKQRLENICCSDMNEEHQVVLKR
jgi:hypothetical protein